MNNHIINSMKLSSIIIITGLIFVAWSCGTDSEVDDLPDPTGEEVWNQMQQEDYQNTWNLWPGTKELYEGTEPHGMLLTTYLNDIAYEAVMNGSTTLPHGSIIAKENYMPDGPLNAITTMYKVEDFNPEHNDWFWLSNNPEGVVNVEGIVNSCQSCHQQVAASDYIFQAFPE